MKKDYKDVFSEAYYEALETTGSEQEASKKGTEAVLNYTETMANYADRVRKERLENGE